MDDQQPINAWRDAEQRYKPGQEVQGVVTRVTQFGVFVQVEPALEGVVYAFELGVGPAAMLGFAPGQEMTLYVKSIDASRKRLELSLHNDPMPGLLDERILPPEEIRARQQPAASSAQTWPFPLPLSETPARAPTAHQLDCPGCQRAVQANWKFCVYCGGSLQRRCANCNSLQPDLPDARYCCQCGQQL